MVIKKKLVNKFNKKYYEKNKIMKIYSIPDIVYDEKILKSPEKIVVYSGYWQREKYFKEIENEIRKVFSFPELDGKIKR